MQFSAREHFVLSLLCPPSLKIFVTPGLSLSMLFFSIMPALPLHYVLVCSLVLFLTDLF